jgi:hypothetical protein
MHRCGEEWSQWVAGFRRSNIFRIHISQSARNDLKRFQIRRSFTIDEHWLFCWPFWCISAFPLRDCLAESESLSIVVFPYLDNARPHHTSNKHDKFEIKRFPYPLHSPDLASCDFWLFVHLRHCIEGHFFDDEIAVEGTVAEILMPIESDMYMRVFAEWKHRLQ